MALSDEKAIGGSDIPVLCGVAPDSHGTPIDIWARITGLAPPKERDNRALRRGRLLEGPILEMAREELGLSIEPGGPYQCYETWHRATLDAWAAESPSMRVPVEAKSVGRWRAHDWADGQYPIRVEMQCQWYLYQTHTPYLYLVALLGGEEFVHRKVEGSIEVQELILGAVDRFWKDYVLTKTPPPPDESTSYRDWLRRRYPHSEGHLLPADATAESWASIYAEARKRKEEAEKAERLARNNLEAIIAGADGIVGSDWKILSRTTKPRVSIDGKGLAKALNVPQEVLSQYSTSTTYRSFRFYKQGDSNGSD